VSEQIDRDMRTVALPWRTDLSHHRAVSFRKDIPVKDSAQHRGVTSAALSHPQFKQRTILNYETLCSLEPSDTAIRRLVLFKRAMCLASDNITREGVGYEQAETLGDKLGATMRLLRAMEKQRVGPIGSCLQQYHLLATLVSNPYDFRATLLCV